MMPSEVIRVMRVSRDDVRLDMCRLAVQTSMHSARIVHLPTGIVGGSAEDTSGSYIRCRNSAIAALELKLAGYYNVDEVQIQW